MFKSKVNRTVFLGLLFTIGCLYTAVGVFDVGSDTIIESLINIVILTLIIIFLATIPVLIKMLLRAIRKNRDNQQDHQ